MTMTSGPGNPLLDHPVAFLFTDGSAPSNGTARSCSPIRIGRKPKAVGDLS